MDKFRSKFFEKSPIKEVARGRASRLRKRAQRRSERSGETGGYDYSDMKVLKLLSKAKRIENKNFIKDLGFKEGSKRKKKADNSSPLKGAYESAVDGMAFMGSVITGEEQFAQLQKDIAKGFEDFMGGEGTQAYLQEKSQARIDNMEENSDERKRAQAAHDSRFSTKTNTCPKGQTLELVVIDGKNTIKCV